MNKSLVLDFEFSDTVNDDFAHATLLQKIQNGEEVAAEEFQHFMRKGMEIIRMLQEYVITSLHHSARQ